VSPVVPAISPVAEDQDVPLATVTQNWDIHVYLFYRVSIFYIFMVRTPPDQT
jgi:hypothetical protein